MEKMIAVCGLDCAACGAFIASKTNDNELRKKVAAEWTVAHNFAFTADMINCHGCHATDSVQIGHCSMCEMRKCATEKKAHTCKDCADYPCPVISGFHAVCPQAAQNFA